MAVPEDARQAVLHVVRIGPHHLQILPPKLVPCFVQSLRRPEEEVEEDPVSVRGGGGERRKLESADEKRVRSKGTKKGGGKSKAWK